MSDCTWNKDGPPWVCSTCGKTYTNQGELRLSKRPPRRRCQLSKEQQQSKGPGTELKRLIKKFKIKIKVNCKCNKHSLLMDQKGAEWCERNIELIVDWLEEEAEKRGLPFVRLAGKMLVKRAIRNSRKTKT